MQSKANRIQIDAKFTGLPDSSKFGLEYLTYVLWAISPQGRAVNLGEVVNKNGNAQLKASVDMQTFGMIVTAEPYYAVAQPGDEVVLENAVPEKMLNRVENVSTSYNLISKGSYSQSNTPIENAIFGVDRKAPSYLFQARNAVRIARNAHADTYAAASFKKATDQLQQAETAYQDRKNSKIVIAAARNAIETAEESRVIAGRRKPKRMRSSKRKLSVRRPRHAKQRRKPMQRLKPRPVRRPMRNARQRIRLARKLKKRRLRLTRQRRQL